MTLRPNRMIFALMALALPLSSLAQDPAPRDVRDLVGARASSGETALKDRGWEVYKTEKGSDRIWTNWWNQQAFTCITVVTLDGRYDSIVKVPTLDCGLADPGSSNSGSEGREWVQDLVGGRASGADAEFAKRGFRNVDGAKEGYKSITWWHSDRNGACLRMTVSEGRVEDITPTPSDCD